MGIEFNECGKKVELEPVENVDGELPRAADRGLLPVCIASDELQSRLAFQRRNRRGRVRPRAPRLGHGCPLARVCWGRVEPDSEGLGKSDAFLGRELVPQLFTHIGERHAEGRPNEDDGLLAHCLDRKMLSRRVGRRNRVGVVRRLGSARGVGGSPREMELPRRTVLEGFGEVFWRGNFRDELGNALPPRCFVLRLA